MAGLGYCSSWAQALTGSSWGKGGLFEWWVDSQHHWSILLPEAGDLRGVFLRPSYVVGVCVWEREGGCNSADLLSLPIRYWDIKLTEGGPSARTGSCLIASKEGTKSGTSVTLFVGIRSTVRCGFQASLWTEFSSMGACKGSHCQYQALWDIEPVTPVMTSVWPTVPMFQWVFLKLASSLVLTRSAMVCWSPF